MRVLLSIKPEFVERIFAGTKCFEFRRRAFGRAVSTVVVYATRPVGKIVGEFDVETILADSPPELWDKTAEYSGITRAFFDAYYEGRDVAYALKISSYRLYPEPIDPEEMFEDFTPPQSYMYVDERNSRPSLQQPLLL